MITDYLKYYIDKTILVTGGAGSIGSYLTRILSDSGARKVIVFDDLSSGYIWNLPVRDNIKFVKGSVINPMDLEKVFCDEPQIVFHLAALFANQNSIEHPVKDLMVNGLGTLNLLDKLVSVPLTRFVYISSSSIYNGSELKHYKEESYESLLTTPYQITKKLGEEYCGYFFRHFGIPTVILRLFNSYGPGEVPGKYRNVIPNFLYSALNKHPLLITGSGEETRDFTYISDVVDGILRAGCSDKVTGMTINLATSTETKIIDLANLINEILNNESGIQFQPRRKWDTMIKKIGSYKLANQVLNYSPQIGLYEGLVRTIDWMRINWVNIQKSIN